MDKPKTRTRTKKKEWRKKRDIYRFLNFNSSKTHKSSTNIYNKAFLAVFFYQLLEISY